MWADLEQAVVAQVQTEPGYRYVRGVAEPGYSEPTEYPAASIQWIAATRVEEPNHIFGVPIITYRVDIRVLIRVRDESSFGESRLGIGGVFDMVDRTRAKLMGFSPTLVGSVRCIRPMNPKQESIN